MTEVTLSAPVADVAVTAVAGPRKPRKPSVSAAQYLTALKAGSAANPKKTAQNVADELGMEKTSFDQRLNQYRLDWKDYGFVLKVKAFKATNPEATSAQIAESLKMTQEDFDTSMVRNTENGNYDAFELNDELLATYSKPFPWTLADGRSNRDGESTKGATARNAILAALADIG